MGEVGPINATVLLIRNITSLIGKESHSWGKFLEQASVKIVPKIVLWGERLDK